MNNKISTLIAAGALMLAGTACNESWDPAPSAGQGSLSLKSMGVNVNTTTKVYSRAEGEAIDLKPFVVKIVPLDGGEATQYTYGTMPEVLPLAVGQYRVDVESHAVQPAEWDKPYYAGSSKAFAIENNKVTEIGVITCEFSSLKVTVGYTDDLRAALGDDVTVTVVANTGGTLVFTPAETRAGYFEVVEGSMTLVATFEGTVDGTHTTQTVTFGQVSKGVHYMLTFKVKNPPSPPEQHGTVDPSGITVEGVVSEVDINGNVDPGDDPTLDPSDRPGTGGGEEPDPPTPPTPGTDDITFHSDNLDLEGVNDATTFSGDAIVTITSKNGFEHLIVKIVSDGLTPEELANVGLASEFDLANPGALEEALQGFGFPIGTQVTGAQGPINFDITDFVPLLSAFPGCQHTFIITVTDKTGIQKSLSLKFKS